MALWQIQPDDTLSIPMICWGGAVVNKTIGDIKGLINSEGFNCAVLMKQNGYYDDSQGYAIFTNFGNVSSDLYLADDDYLQTGDPDFAHTIGWTFPTTDKFYGSMLWVCDDSDPTKIYNRTGTTFNYLDTKVIDNKTYHWLKGNYAEQDDFPPIFITTYNGTIYYNGQLPTQYTWKPIPSVGGKMGLFEFSEIKEEFIGDGSQVTNAPDSNILRFMDSSKLSSIGGNLFVTTPTEVCYSGDDNAMIFTRTYTPLIGDTFVISFNIGGTCVYSYASVSSYDDVYLSFVVDEENEVAAISLLYVNNNPVQVTYNMGGLDPSHDLYLWFAGNYNTDPEENEPEDPEGANPWVDEGVPGLDVPTISAVDTGFTSMYVVTKSELQSLAQYMWSDSFLTNLKKLFSDPRQIIVGLTMFPLTPDVGDSKEIKAGGISTGVYGLPLSSQYKLLDDFGSIYVQKEKGCFLDYPPFTKVVAHLPYVGEHELDVNDIMGKTIALKYLFDFLTGACVAEIDVNGKPRYFFSGQTGVQIPTSSEDFTRQFTSFLSAGVAIGTALAAPSIGAAAAPMMIGAEVNAINNGMSPTVSYSSGGGGVNGFLSSQGAYITIELPENKLAAKQPKFVGKPSYIYAEQLEDCKGYIKCYSVHLDAINCLPSERREIEQRLLAGCRIEEGSSTPSYTPTETGDYGLIFMKMSSDLDVIGKSWDSTTLTIEGKLFYEKDITKPVFLISGNVSAYNYCYIPHFNRFYHIEEIVDKTGSMQEIHMSVDPLQSFKSDILDCDAILERAEDSDFINSKFNDSMMWTQQNKKIITVNFKANGTLSKFPRNSNVYVLTIAGGD